MNPMRAKIISDGITGGSNVKIILQADDGSEFDVTSCVTSLQLNMSVGGLSTLVLDMFAKIDADVVVDADIQMRDLGQPIP